MIDPERIKEVHDIPNAVVTKYSHYDGNHAIEAMAFACKQDADEFMIIATQAPQSELFSFRRENADLLELGNNKFNLGVLKELERQAGWHADALTSKGL